MKECDQDLYNKKLYRMNRQDIIDLCKNDYMLGGSIILLKQGLCDYEEYLEKFTAFELIMNMIVGNCLGENTSIFSAISNKNIQDTTITLEILDTDLITIINKNNFTISDAEKLEYLNLLANYTLYNNKTKINVFYKKIFRKYNYPLIINIDRNVYINIESNKVDYIDYRLKNA